MNTKLHHDLLNLVNALASAQYNLLMLSTGRGGVENKQNVIDLCQHIVRTEENSSTKIPVEAIELSKKILEFYDRTSGDEDLILAELTRVENTLKEIKELAPLIQKLVKEENRSAS